MHKKGMVKFTCMKLCFGKTANYANNYSRLKLVLTMCGLCALAALTVWKMSTPPSTLTLSISVIQVMNTPLRDMPSLKYEYNTIRDLHASYVYTNGKYCGKRR